MSLQPIRRQETLRVIRPVWHVSVRWLESAKYFIPIEHGRPRKRFLPPSLGFAREWTPAAPSLEMVGTAD